MSKKSRHKKDRRFHAIQSIFKKEAPSDVYYSTLRRAKRRRLTRWVKEEGRTIIFFKNFWWVVNEESREIITVLTIKEFENRRGVLAVQSKSQEAEAPFNNPFVDFFKKHNLSGGP